MRGAVPVLAAAATLVGLSACESRDSIGVDKPASPMPAGPHLDLDIRASKDTRYQMLCDVRTYQTPEGAYANRYGVEKAGPYKDYIPSPLAHCTAKIVAGPGPLTVTLSRPGLTRSMTIAAPGDAGKTTLHVW